ncbi:TPA: transcriptional regulator NrdR [bacterium]|nr:MAG: transcriptional regulator NrdR [Candidatus Hydrogenedentes bacterium CG1_02_42_14]PIU47489.1 MAG: transcriptional regulator NrdR [Candidatus Hydrogenedentes bacterium CG07_land_8_20_14_0_80_42_17]HBW46544.1 transcriptional regulator NrdR [bacterium]
MKCPFCKTGETGVIETRAWDDGTVIWRRRECHDCDRRFSTYERMEMEPLVVVKKDGTREIFSREKLLAGVFSACKKTKIPLETLEQFISSIERTFRDEGRREIPSIDIGKEVLAGLKLMDPVAYIRFASVYNELDSVDSFRELLSDFGEEK